jgi:hypothetical protein
VRLDLTVDPRRERRVDFEVVMLEELVDVPTGIRDDPELEPLAPELRQDRRHVVEEVEIVGVLPRPGHLDGALVGSARVTAHPSNDPLSEGDPDLLVMAEVRMLPQPFDRFRAGFLVERRVELEPETAAEALIALRSKIGTGLRQREVEVEEHRLDVHAPTGWEPASGTPRAAETPAREASTGPHRAAAGRARRR